MTGATAVNETLNAALLDHIDLLHRLAAPFAGKGKLILATFGQDPDGINPKNGEPGRSIPPKVMHFEIGDVQGMVRAVDRLGKEPHRNIYMPLVVMRGELKPNSKGSEEDILWQLGLVADFDDAKAHLWAERLPLEPNYVLETSAGRFQAFYLFDEPQTPTMVKKLAERLKGFSKCDHGTADLSHVWRVPGCLNWPNAKKVGEGRSKEPQPVEVIMSWDGTLISATDLSVAIDDHDDLWAVEDDNAAHDDPPPLPPVESTSNVNIKLFLKNLPPKLRQRITEPADDRSRTLFFVIRALIERGLDDVLIERIIREHPDGVGAKYADRDDLDREIARVRTKGPPRSDSAQPNQADGDDWRADLITNNEGEPRPVLANAVLPLRHDPVWKGVLWFNEFSSRMMLRQPPR
jgi:hypothetical protein